MDIEISREKQFSPKKLHLAFLFIGLVAAFFIGKYLIYLSGASFSVDRNELLFDEVKRGEYSVSVRGTGILAPDNIQYLSSEVDATVVKVFVKAGKVVQNGELIVELSNPQLVQELAESKWELEAMGEEFKAARADQESAQLRQEVAVLEAKLETERNLLDYKAHEELVESGAVSKINFERSRLSYDQSIEIHSAAKNELSKIKENLGAQDKARSARLNQATKRVERLQGQVDNLQVKSTMESIVLEMPLEVGHRLVMGGSIAKLAEQNSLIAELQVPEIQIRDVAVGQRVIIDTRNNKSEGVVSRIDPAVVRGNVQVDVEFSDELPSDARPDLSVDGEIKITEIADALYVSRPLFAQSQSNTALYKLTENGKFAERVNVLVGYGSVNQIEIKEGLSPGDVIVTSDPTRFETYDKFRIN